MKRKSYSIFLFLLILLLHSPAMALPSSPLWIHDSGGNLGTYDIATDAVNIIGNMGQVMTDIAFDPSGNLFGITFTGLYSINSANGVSTFIGNHLISGGNALVFGSDGTLYGAGNTTSNLYSINTVTGAGTALGNIGYFSAGDLAFNSGNLYLSAATTGNDTLVLINQTTYDGSGVGSINYDAVFGLATGDDGLLYALSGTNVLSINTATGAGTIIQNYSGAGLGVSFGSSFIAEAKVPEPATVLLLCAGLIGLAGYRRKKLIR